MNTTPRPPELPRTLTSGSPAVITVDTVGTVRIGSRPDAAPCGAPLPVIGGLLVFDPFAPDAAPYLELDAHEPRNWMLPLTLGEAVTDAVTEAADEAGRAVVGPDDDADHIVARRTAPWNPGAGHRAGARMATLLWLSRWSPVALDGELLDIEAGSLLGSLTDVVDDAEDLARVRLARCAPRLVRLATTVLSERSLPGEAWIAELLTDALEHAEDLLVDHPLHPRIFELAEQARRRDTRPRHLQEELDAELRRLLQPSLAIRAQAHQQGWHTSDADWAQLPPGILDSAEGTVRWQVTDRTLTVKVSGGPSASPEAPLGFRAYSPGSPLPVALGRLVPRPLRNGLSWEGGAPLDRPLPTDGLTVDVYHPHYVGPPRLGPAAEQAKAERQSVRYLTQLREHIARQDGHELNRWADIVSADTSVPSAAPLPGGGSDTLTHRMLGLVEAARAAADHFQRLERGHLQQDPDATDTDAPRLCGPIWRPTLAEWARLRVNFGL
ncbi:hypothetical protein [Streptomyces sp. NPDC047028]|uniref:hypothetical protein n=1 Tax=Streptomyces sp. NPDC047028 TaxID=3155793 RepID=UPI0033C38A54